MKAAIVSFTTSSNLQASELSIIELTHNYTQLTLGGSSTQAFVFLSSYVEQMG